MVNKPITEIKWIKDNCARVIAGGIEIDHYFIPEEGEPQIGDLINMDNLISPFAEVTYDLRTKEHRSPFY